MEQEKVYHQANHVLITGTTSGVGRALLEHYASIGCKVTSVNRRKVDELERLYPHIRFFSIDVCDQEGIRKLIATMVAECELPDTFILNAGINAVDNDAFFDLDVYQKVFAVNLMGVMNFVSPLTQLFHQKKSIRIIAISSMGIYLPNPYCMSYHASKKALTASFKILSEMYSSTNSSFSQVILGPVLTPIFDTSNKFPKFMSWIKKIFSASIADTVTAIARLVSSNHKTLLFPWPAYCLFQGIRGIQACLPGFYRGRKTLAGNTRTASIPPREQTVHAK